jgi:subtilisin-like proprotein convertase family protein
MMNDRIKSAGIIFSMIIACQAVANKNAFGEFVPKSFRKSWDNSSCKLCQHHHRPPHPCKKGAAYGGLSYSCVASSCSVPYIYLELGGNIPDQSTVEFPITVKDQFTICKAYIELTHLQHTYASDLVVSVKTPWGSEFPLFSRVDDGSHFNGNFLFLDDAPNSLYYAPIINGVIAPGNYQAAESYAQNVSIQNAVYGQQSKGTWLLVISDVAPEDVGKLDAWAIHLYLQNPPCAVISLDTAAVRFENLTQNGSFKDMEYTPDGLLTIQKSGNYEIIYTASGRLDGSNKIQSYVCKNNNILLDETMVSTAQQADSLVYLTSAAIVPLEKADQIGLCFTGNSNSYFIPENIMLTAVLLDPK